LPNGGIDHQRWAGYRKLAEEKKERLTESVAPMRLRSCALAEV
jgi:hypothetical protein